MNVPALLFGWLIASLIGLLFHLIRGGSLRRLLLYLISAWLGFALGHQLGALTGLTLIRLGAINLFSAVLGSAIALALFEILSPQTGNKKPGAGDERPNLFGRR
jgi:uncharacterized membrane protein YeaQ/YmgE (transglycosylase-associated protein family)